MSIGGPVVTIGDGETIRLGHARVDVTPPIGVPMGGYAARDRGCDAVDDPLYADAIYMRRGDTDVLWITLDLIAVNERWGDTVRREIADKAGVGADRILLLPSHTHFGPQTGSYVTIEDADHEVYIDNLVSLIVDAALRAVSTTTDVFVRLGRAKVDPVVYNRRLIRPDGSCCMVLRLPPPAGEEDLTFGPVDPYLTLLRFDKLDGTPALVFYSVAIHPVIGGENFYAVSADYPGVVRRILERTLGAPVSFGLGTAGNLVPIERGPGQRERIGTFIAGAALKAWSAADPLSSTLYVRHEKIDVPTEPRSSVEEMRVAAEEAARSVRRMEGEKKVGTPLWRRAKDEARRAGALIKHAKRFGPGCSVPFEITSIGIGDLGIVALPGEIFAETGLFIADRSPFPTTLTLSLANQATGYLPTRSAFGAGGYEVSVSMMQPGSEAIVCDHVIGMLVDVWGDQG